jgi:hypothetical protein
MTMHAVPQRPAAPLSAAPAPSREAGDDRDKALRLRKFVKQFGLIGGDCLLDYADLLETRAPRREPGEYPLSFIHRSPYLAPFQHHGSGTPNI